MPYLAKMSLLKQDSINKNLINFGLIWMLYILKKNTMKSF